MVPTVTAAVQPPLTYFGGKTRLARRIASLLPGHQHYVEPYAGSLAVLLAKTPLTAGDRLRPRRRPGHVLADAARAARRPGPRLRADTALPSRAPVLVRPASRSRRPRARPPGVGAAHPGPDERPHPHRVALLRRPGRHQDAHARLPRRLRRPDGTGRRPAAQRQPGVPASAAALDDYGRSPGVLIYADPPYLGSTRKSGRYKHEMLADADHESSPKRYAPPTPPSWCRATTRRSTTGSTATGTASPSRPPPARAAPDRTASRSCGPTG